MWGADHGRQMRGSQVRQVRGRQVSDWKSVVTGESEDLGGRRIIKKKHAM